MVCRLQICDQESSLPHFLTTFVDLPASWVQPNCFENGHGDGIIAISAILIKIEYVGAERYHKNRVAQQAPITSPETFHPI